jgi:hypothetical protein
MHIPSAKSVSFDVGANTTHKYNSDAPPGSEMVAFDEGVNTIVLSNASLRLTNF